MREPLPLSLLNQSTTYVTNLQRIYLPQKRTVRLISKADYRAPSKPVFTKTKILDIFSIYSLQVSSFMYLTILTIYYHSRFAKFFKLAEFPLVLKSRGPGTSRSMKLGVLFAFQGSPDYYRTFFFFSEVLCLFSKRLSYVVCSHNYIFGRLTKLVLLYKTHFSHFYFYILVILSLFYGYFPVGWACP